MTIALDALGDTYMPLAAKLGIDPALLHGVTVIGAGTLDSLPHNGAVVTLLAVCGSTHRESYLDMWSCRSSMRSSPSWRSSRWARHSGRSEATMEYG
jgi:H+/gluconate symporter-like permease